MPLPPLPPVLVRPQAPKETRSPTAPRATFDQAAARILDAFDLGQAPGPEQPLSAKDLPAYRWLRACATAPRGKVPENPFPAGSTAHAEAEALRTFLALPTEAALRRLPTLPLSQLGTHLAVWRWGSALCQRGEFAKAQRQAFEDRLLATPGSDLTLGYALRHALSYALAEKDEGRLGELRARTPEGQESLYHGFQAAFGLLGGPLPSLRLWTLPGTEAREVQLGKDGAAVWMSPIEGPDLPALPPGMVWVVPSATGDQDARDPQLAGPIAAEAQVLAGRLSAGGRQAFLAASRQPFEKVGLVYFPILLRFDGQGNVVAILMGDAAPKGPSDRP